MPTPYVLQPEWEWPITIALFIAGVASGTYAAMGLIHFAGDRGDQPVAHRLAFIPMPLMLLVPILLTLDLGQPGRFANLLLRSPAAAERGPFPLMFNVNSPMNWGSWALVAFGAFSALAFVDALSHSGRLRWNVEGLAHNVVILAIGELLALVVSGYSGVLVNTTNQGVWSDTFLMGALFVCFSELSGLAVAAIVSDRLRAVRTSAAIGTAIFGAAVVSGVVLVLFLIGLGIQQDGSLGALAASLLVGPVFWIGAVGLAVLVPLLLLAPRPILRVPNATLTIIGAIVLVGVFAFRYAMFFSAIAFV